MTYEERLRVFIDSFDKGNTGFLDSLEKEALEKHVPVIRRETQKLLRTLLALQKPMNILEVGTAVGFSTLLMCEYGLGQLHVTTIENDEERAMEAEKNFREAGRQEQITLLAGDADDLLQTLEGPFDLIFMDAAKGQYIHWLPDVIRLMHPGSLLVSDNVLQNGDLVQSHFVVERRKRTIYKRMREYLFALTHDPLLETVILPTGDGTALSVKLEETDE